MKSLENHNSNDRLNSFVITEHARQRMTSRRVSSRDIENVLSFGREVYSRGACIFAVGRKEVSRLKPKGIDLRRQEGLQVICSPEGAVLTVYRNHDFSTIKH